MTLTKQAKKDFNKIFHKDYKQDEIEPIIAKKNWHREKQKNKEKEIYKRAKQDFPNWMLEQKKVSVKKIKINSTIKVSVERQEQVKYVYRNGSPEYSKKMISIKDTFDKGIYHQDVSSWVRLNRYGQNYCLTQPIYSTRIYQNLYITSLTCNNLTTNITSKFPIFSDESITEITKKELTYYIKESLNKGNILSYSINDYNVFRSGIIWRLQRKFDFIELIDNIDNFFYLDTEYYIPKKIKNKYSILKNKIYKEINFYSGMRKLSKGKTKLNKDLKDIITYSNLIFKTTDKNFFNNDCFLKDKEIVTWIPACLDCQKKGWEYCPEGELNINYPSSMFIMDVEPLYSDVRKNYETWEYIY